jgi:hypothetical protein
VAAITVLPVLAPFLVALYHFLVAQLPANRRDSLTGLVRSAVLAAEQVYANAPGSGQAKEQFVLSKVAAASGGRLNPALVKVVLEEAVYCLNEAQGHSPSDQHGNDVASGSSMGFVPPSPAPAPVSPAL